MIANVKADDLMAKINELCLFVTEADPYLQRMKLVAMLKDIVPEYVSNNSVFERLDDRRVG